MKTLFLFSFSLLLLISCSEKPVPLELENELYFPPINESTWETIDPIQAGFNTNNIAELYAYLENTNTKGFIILKEGKIVIEEYFNNHTQNTNWYCASAGKTLTAATIGIAQQEGFLNITDPTSDYLENGWTTLTSSKESLISIQHQLSMTSGLDDSSEFSCYDPECLTYLTDAGTRWAYHNGPYTLLQEVVTKATSQEFRSYFNAKIRDQIGMNGFWVSLGDIELYNSTTRSMARFGLLALNNFVWDETPILTNTTFTQDLVNTSQNLNLSYGYLWWLNGKSSYKLPQSQLLFNGSLIPNAPNDMFVAMEKTNNEYM